MAKAKRSYGISAHGWKFNWRPDLPDHRDQVFVSLSELSSLGKHLPKRVDLRPKCPALRDQGKIGSCTAAALSALLEYAEQKKARDRGKIPTVAPLSRLFIYFFERELECLTNKDSGSTLRNGLKTLHRRGTCLENTWNYSKQNVFKKPTTKAEQEARHHRIRSYYRLLSLDDMKGCLAGGHPFAFGMTVYESFERPSVAKSGIVPLPDPKEALLGGHCVAAVGYDDEEGALIVRNSWGENWGIQGHFLLPFEYITRPGLAADFWTLRL